ncbi:hypothetical protein FH972_014024 [Carpinus fangiana]|uniref:F-box domain-containing protein n=1 Tax=Carpinus fangiana TaxID=176857 RepID=A0A5N6RA94_9ROSI|nr:hypothetical protein FH972_014024 [Carpinus fangiana]
MAVDWTQLPQELLKSIADDLKIYAHYLRFRKNSPVDWWTQLRRELLKSIADNLKIYADCLRFRAVCHSWRSSVPNTPRHATFLLSSHGSCTSNPPDPIARFLNPVPANFAISRSQSQRPSHTTRALAARPTAGSCSSTTATSLERSFS